MKNVYFLYKIKGKVVKDSIELLFLTKKFKWDTKLVVGKLGFSEENLRNQSGFHNNEEGSLSKAKKVKIGQERFVKLAECCCSEKTTLIPLLHTKIYDKILEGKEYQLIEYKYFYQ